MLGWSSEFGWRAAGFAKGRDCASWVWLTACKRIVWTGATGGLCASLAVGAYLVIGYYRGGRTIAPGRAALLIGRDAGGVAHDHYF